MGKRQVDVRFNLIDDFTAGFNKTMQTLTAGTKQAEKAWKSVEKTGKNIANVGDQLTAAVTLPITAMGVSSYKTFSDVDKNLQLVKATMGEAKYATADLSKALSDAAANSIFSMREGSEALVNFARQGWDAKQSADMLASSFNLAAGTTTDIDVVTSGLGNTLKAFGASSAEATHYTDMFTVAQAQANTSVEQLFEAMSVAGPIAKTVGWEFEDIATLVGAFGDMSIDASEGANALKTGLSRLSGGNKEVNEAMDALRISLYDDKGNMMDMTDAIGTLQKAFEPLNQQEQMFYASKLFGANQMSKWLALINGPTADALNGMRENIKNADGDAQRAADALMTPLERIASSFDSLKYSLGAALADYVVPFLDKIREMVDAFRQMDPEQQKQIVKWAMIAAAAGPVIGIFGRVVSTVGSVGGAFTKLVQFGSKAAGGFKALSSGAGLAKAGMAALSAPAAVVIAIIAAIGVVIVSVVTHFETFKAALASTGGFEKLKEAFNGLREQFTASMPMLTKIADLIGNVIAAAAGVAAGAIGTFLAGAIESTTGILQAFTSLVTGIDKLIHGDLTGALEAFKGVFDGAVKFVSGLFDGLFGTIKSIGDAISSIKIPEWGDANGHKYEVTEARAVGDVNWRGGLVQVHERGGEILDLPHGTRIYPHDVSMAMAKNAGGGNVTIPKIADQIIVREDADIERIGDAIVRKLRTASIAM
ncbi:MAG: phage tail tape measure protein [Oribacterium sp.]|nr:phage tail tape measure protein [Oribacterium sp.]